MEFPPDIGGTLRMNSTGILGQHFYFPAAGQKLLLHWGIFTSTPWIGTECGTGCDIPQVMRAERICANGRLTVCILPLPI